MSSLSLEHHPEPRLNLQPIDKHKNALDLFKDRHESEYKTWERRSRDRFEEIEQHNRTYPKMHEELWKKKSLIKIKAIGRKRQAESRKRRMDVARKGVSKKPKPLLECSKKTKGFKRCRNCKKFVVNKRAAKKIDKNAKAQKLKHFYRKPLTINSSEMFVRNKGCQCRPPYSSVATSPLKLQQKCKNIHNPKRNNRITLYNMGVSGTNSVQVICTNPKYNTSFTNSYVGQNSKCNNTSLTCTEFGSNEWNRSYTNSEIGSNSKCDNTNLLKSETGSNKWMRTNSKIEPNTKCNNTSVTISEIRSPSVMSQNPDSRDPSFSSYHTFLSMENEPMI